MNLDPKLPFPYQPERRGQRIDLFLLEEDAWMQDTEVKYVIQRIRGRWHVHMVFFSLKEPMKIVVRHIDHYHSKQKAERFAKIFQRGIRKDARGTLQRESYAYHICNN